MSEPHVFVGIDGSRTQRDVALRPTDDGWHVSHDEVGSTSLVERLQAVQPTLVGLEATGGLEAPVTGALAEAGLPVVVVHPRHTREFATATGRLAKTDPLEAHGLAHVAEAVRPTPRPLPEAQAPALSAPLTRRRQVVSMRTAERRRLHSAPQWIQAHIQAHITWLERRVARPDEDLAAAIRASPLGRATDAILQRMPGVGPVLSPPLVAEGPEWSNLVLVGKQKPLRPLGNQDSCSPAPGTHGRGNHTQPGVLNRTVRGHAIIARSQRRTTTRLCHRHPPDDGPARRVWCSPPRRRPCTESKSEHDTGC